MNILQCFNHSPVDGHFGCFHFFANNAARTFLSLSLSADVQEFLQGIWQSLVGFTLRSISCPSADLLCITGG